MDPALSNCGRNADQERGGRLRRSAQESMGIGLQRFTSQSATRPQLKQMKRGVRASCMTDLSCPWLTRTQRCPLCSPLHACSFMVAYYTGLLSKSQAACLIQIEGRFGPSMNTTQGGSVNRSDIPVQAFQVPAAELWDHQRLLLAAGDFSGKDYNCMTVGWGGFGVMWNRPLAMVVVRPTRYTWHFMERSDSFSLSAFPGEFETHLSYCGNNSGRDGDKAAAVGLTPIACRLIKSPGFAEAELIVECRKSYWSDFEPAHFVDSGTESHYPKKDYHRMYFGEIVAISGTPRWRTE
jgi:flavin reductase (DIM6/NTAB) family NADH-FMN oxidoreductase RutF